MKSLLLAVTLTTLSLTSVWAGEVTGAGRQALQVLRSHNVSVEALKTQGFKVLLGEVTGAGKTIDLDRIDMVVTQNKLLKMNQASHIKFKHPSQAKALRDVEHLEFNSLRVSPNQIKGLIYE
jgi:hypothetical protein